MTGVEGADDEVTGDVIVIGPVLGLKPRNVLSLRPSRFFRAIRLWPVVRRHGPYLTLQRPHQREVVLSVRRIVVPAPHARVVRMLPEGKMGLPADLLAGLPAEDRKRRRADDFVAGEVRHIRGTRGGGKSAKVRAVPAHGAVIQFLK